MKTLEPSTEAMRALIDQALDRILPHLESLPRQPAGDPGGGIELARSLVEPLPEEGTEFGELLDFLFEKAIPKSFNTAGPGYLAYIPGGGIFHTAVADLIADTVNRYVGVFAAAPVLAQLESNVIRWFCRIVGLPEGSGGTLTTGGSIANFSAIVTARRDRLPENFLRGTIYVSDQVHHSVEKSAVLAGFPARNVRKIATDSRFRMRAADVADAVRRDREEGFEPFLIVGSAGTTNTGAIDELEALADLARDENLWFHVDGAYGAFFMLTGRGRKAMKGIERADSVTLDPHKGLFLPYGTGSLLVRDRATLLRAHSVRADYMPPMQEDTELVDFCEISPELSRAFRGLRVWLPFRMLGIGPFRESLDEKLDLTTYATDELRKIGEMEIVAEPQLSIVAFRLHPDGLGEEELNTLNQRLLDGINGRQNVMMTPTRLDGRFVIRICVLSFRTHLDRMELAMQDVREACREVRSE